MDIKHEESHIKARGIAQAARLFSWLNCDHLHSDFIQTSRSAVGII